MRFIFSILVFWFALEAVIFALRVWEKDFNSELTEANIQYLGDDFK